VTDQELRALVREAIAKQLGEPAPAGWRGPSGPAHDSHHPSHGVYAIAREDDNGPCIIEPSVPCTHCNYCKSHGH
jgi:hypothetical protein